MCMFLVKIFKWSVSFVIVMHGPLIDFVQGYTWFFSIIGTLVCFGAIGSFITYRMMVSR